MKVTQISIGRFHHFHLARQLERQGMLEEIWTGYPRSKLANEAGIPAAKIRCFPWLQAPYMGVIARNRFGLANWQWFAREWNWQAHRTLERHVARKLKSPTILIALSNSGLKAGQRAQQTGGRFVCDRGSTHIRFQNQILTEEYQRWGLKYKGIDPRVIRQEEAEYAQADAISVPSEFVRRSFLELGVPAEKVKKIIYGADFSRFKKVQDPDPNRFRILWVGSVSIRKGFLYLLEAFQKLQHPQKELAVIGGMDDDLRQLLAGRDLQNVTFLGHVPNQELSRHYSQSHVFALTSLEEGLALVQGEALACGCPVLASTNTGGEDLFDAGREGFIVPIRSAAAILEKLENLAQDPALRQKMSEAAIRRVQQTGGWQTYGDNFAAMLKKL